MAAVETLVCVSESGRGRGKEKGRENENETENEGNEEKDKYCRDSVQRARLNLSRTCFNRLPIQIPQAKSRRQQRKR